MIEGLPDDTGLLTLLLLLLFGPPMLASKIGARLPGVLGFVGRWWQNREDSNPDRPSYRVLVQEVERLSASNARLDARQVELETRVTGFEEKLTKSNRRLWAAIERIRLLTGVIKRLDPEHELPEVPELLTDLL